MGCIKNASPCPFCKKLLSGYFSQDKDSTPSPGDPSVCVHCGEFLEFDKNMNLVEISDELLLRISSADLKQIKRVVENYRALQNEGEGIQPTK